MNKKTIIAIVAVILVLVLGAIIYFVVANQPKTLNLEELSNKIAESGKFNEMATMEVDNELLTTLMHVNTDNVEQVVGKFPLMNVQSSMYMILKVKEGTMETVKAEVEQYVQDYDAQWARYLPDQYEYVQNRKFDVYGDYLYLIIAENSTELEALIK